MNYKLNKYINLLPFYTLKEIYILDIFQYLHKDMSNNLSLAPF